MHEGLITMEQLFELTGFKQKAALKRWLRENRIVFQEGAGGRPVTTLAAFQRSLDRQSPTGPNWTPYAKDSKRPPQRRSVVLRQKQEVVSAVQDRRR